MSKVVNGEINDTFMSFISKDKYSRWLEDQQRRETWEETVNRYCGYMKSRMDRKYPGVYDTDFWENTKNHILNLEVMPSMRAMMMSGVGLDANELSAYNCAFLAFDDVRAFDELMFILSSGTGVGFSVEQEHVDKLPIVAESLVSVPDTVVVEDSREGWADALRQFVDHLYHGRIPSLDISRVRPSGSRLMTTGGTASGPQPLVDALDFIVSTFRGAVGRKLKPIEVHDIACQIGDSIVSGGVRRSALISLSSLSDRDMANAKSGEWWVDNPQRKLANNSAVYRSKPSDSDFAVEWETIYNSFSGERGIFNMESAKLGSRSPRRNSEKISGTNPCGEIFLRSSGLCNLSEVVVRDSDTLETLMSKVEIATALGTIQSDFTDFHYLRSIWRENAEEERLLGVSLTGVFSNQLMSGVLGRDVLEESLTTLRNHVISVNKKLSSEMGINQSVATTTVKPSGTVSLLTYSASGLHPWHSQYYIRTIRANVGTPMAEFLKSQGVPHEADVTKPEAGLVFSFPFKAPDGAVKKSDITALQHLDLWLTYKKFWTEHNPSVTIDYLPHEWEGIGEWVKEHWDDIGGLSFLPAADHVYAQAPLQELSGDEYNQWVVDNNFPETLDWDDLQLFELADTTTGSRQLACVSGECEIVEIS